MKKLLLILIPFVLTALLYCAVSFFFMSSNPNDWNIEGRAIFSIFGPMILVGTSIILYSEYNNSKKKP